MSNIADGLSLVRNLSSLGPFLAKRFEHCICPGWGEAEALRKLRCINSIASNYGPSYLVALQ